MQITLDVGTSSNGTRPDPVKPGRYGVRIDEVRESKTKDGAPSLGVRLGIEHGDYAGRILWTNLILAPTGLGRLRAFLKAIGEPSEGTVDINTNRFIGRHLSVKVSIEIYPVGGQTKRNTILKFLPTTSTRRQQPPPNRPTGNELTHG